MSGGNTNTTISHPGNDWQVLWGNGNGWKNFQLDIVGFLAILGESAVTANAQVSALSRLFYLPRLLPAPQALLPPSRPTELPTEKAWVTGVFSGNNKEHLHHIANILLGEERLPKYCVRCIKITKKKPKGVNASDVYFRGLRSASSMKESDDELQPSPVKARATGPLTWVTLIGFFLSVALFVISIVWGDGFSLIATILLSFLSTLIGFANKWELAFSKVASEALLDGDVVVRYPIGSFIVVKCNEEVARELFFAPEEIQYHISHPVASRLISLVGTLILMLGIIFLANAKLELQFAWAGAYIIINAAHWVAAAVPPGSHWDLSCYEVREEGVLGGPDNANFTAALWKATVLTKSVDWVQLNKAAPVHKAWNDWLNEAEREAKAAKFHLAPLVSPNPAWPHPAADEKAGSVVWDVPPWDAKARWNEIQQGLSAAKDEKGAVAVGAVAVEKRG